MRMAQLLLLAILATLAALVFVSLPEIKRYLRIREM
jgi:hypothetical protein